MTTDNDRLISEMGKEDFMRFVRREILNFQDETTKNTYVKNFSWFVRGVCDWQRLAVLYG